MDPWPTMVVLTSAAMYRQGPCLNLALRRGRRVGIPCHRAALHPQMPVGTPRKMSVCQRVSNGSPRRTPATYVIPAMARRIIKVVLIARRRTCLRASDPQASSYLCTSSSMSRSCARQCRRRSASYHQCCARLCRRAGSWAIRPSWHGLCPMGRLS
jgi:hypothetical protein